MIAAKKPLGEKTVLIDQIEGRVLKTSKPSGLAGKNLRAAPSSM